MKPNKSEIELWINALRSGRYKQTKKALQDEHGFCCLGVACDIFIPEKKKEFYDDSEAILIGDTPEYQHYAPEWLKKIDNNFCRVTGAALTSLNDVKDVTFDEIADCLQLVYIEEALGAV